MRALDRPDRRLLARHAVRAVPALAVLLAVLVMLSHPAGGADAWPAAVPAPAPSETHPGGAVGKRIAAEKGA